MQKSKTDSNDPYELRKPAMTSKEDQDFFDELEKEIKLHKTKTEK